MTFRKGESGNPRGRVAVRDGGTPNKRTKLEQALMDAAPGVQAAVIEAALGGCMQAASLVMARVSSPLRARASPVQFHLDPDAPVDVQAKQILVAVSRGEVDPDTGEFLFNCLSTFLHLRDREIFVGRLKALRQGVAKEIVEA